MSIRSEIISSLDTLEYAEKEIGTVWRMPSPEDCIDFAGTEVGEVINDSINMRSAGYARNNSQRSPEVAKELADVAMMLLKYFASAYGFEKARGMLDKIFGRAEKEVNGPDDELPGTFLEFLKMSGIDSKMLTDIAKISALVSYAMMMMQAKGIGPNVDTIIASTLFLIAGNEMFSEKPLSEYIKDKIQATIEKVKTRSMNIV